MSMMPKVARFPEELKSLINVARNLGGENTLLERACSERLDWSID